MARPLSRLLARSVASAATQRTVATTSAVAASGQSTAMSTIRKAFANRNFDSHEELYKFSIEKVISTSP